MKISNTKIVLMFCLFFSNLANAEYGEWNAQVIDVDRMPTAHYINETPEGYQHSAMDFDDGDLEGLVVEKGVSAVSTKGGKLTFRVEKDAKLYWQSFDSGSAERKASSLEAEWENQAWPWVVQVKIKQSKQKSKWALEADYLGHGKRKTTKSEIILLGQKEQVVQFNMGTAKREYFGFRLASMTPNNNISIDWIKAVRPSIKKVFHYKFNIQNDPIASKLLFSANGKTSVFLNGEKLGTHGAKHPYSRMLNVYQNVRSLNRGMNELCVTVEGYSSNSNVKNPGRQFFFLEGMVVDADGGLVNLKTDKTWQGAYSNEGCSTRDEALKQVTVLGSVKNIWPVLAAMQPHERFGGRPYLGRIILDYNSDDKPVYLESKDTVLKINVLGVSLSNNVNQFIKYKLKIWSDDKRNVEQSLHTGLVSEDDGLINFGKLNAGVYELFLTYYVNGKIVDERRQELTVVGKITQNIVAGNNFTQGMQLKKIDFVEFSPKMKQKVLCGKAHGKDSEYLNKDQGIISKISGLVEANLQEIGLELSSQRAAWCSIKFNTGQLYQPHLVEIEYPDDDVPRNMLFVVAEESRFPNINNIGKGGGIPRLSTGVYTKGQKRATTAVKRFIYWPNKKDATLTIVNAGRDFINRGAIKSLTVYEIEGDLPAFSIPSSDKSELLIGQFVERVDRTTPRLFYGGSLEAKFSHELMRWGNFSGYYNAWYTTISNLIKYMRFSGQNTYYAGIYMYSGGWFRSENFQGHSESGIDYFGAGWNDGAIDIMAKMFEENGMNLVLGVEFIGSRKLSEVNNITDTEVVDGIESIRFVDKNGRQVHGFQNQGYNFLSTKVSDEIITLADEIANKFSQYKAVKGITWMRQPEFPLAPISIPGRTPLDIGYGDLTVSLYKQQTDSLLPSSSDDRMRFNHRYNWIMEHEKENWIQWRCQKVFEFDSKIADVFSSYRNDWKVWRIVPRPVPELIKKWGSGEINSVDVYRYTGIDPALYTKSDSLSLMLINDIGAENKYALRKKIAPLLNEASKFYYEIGKNKELESFSMFANIGFILETKLRTKEKWPWQHLKVVGYSVPSDEGLYSKLLEFTPTQGREAIAFGWSDSGHFSGYEQDVRNYWLKIQAQ